MVAKTQGARQANDAHQVHGELLAVHLLHVQLHLWDDRDVGQELAVGHQAVLVQLPASGETRFEGESKFC
jgi:hypothetical protein